MAKRTQAPATTPAPAAVVVPTTASTPARRGNSTIPTPVAQVWVTCHNACTKARNEGTAVPARKVLVGMCIDLGVAYYTARTQVQAYLKASLGGTVNPTKLPRAVVLN